MNTQQDSFDELMIEFNKLPKKGKISIVCITWLIFILLLDCLFSMNNPDYLKDMFIKKSEVTIQKKPTKQKSYYEIHGKCRPGDLSCSYNEVYKK